MRLRWGAFVLVLLIAAFSLAGCVPHVAAPRSAHPTLTSQDFVSPDRVWAGHADEGSAWDTGIPASVEVSKALALIAPQLRSHPDAYFVTDVSEGWAVDGPDAIKAMSRVPDFSNAIIAEFCTVATGSPSAVWTRTVPTGQYAVSLRDGRLTTGFIARRDPRTGTWWADQEQTFATGFGYLAALHKVEHRTRKFDVRIVIAKGEPATSWIIFRLGDGEVFATPAFLVPNFKWRADGAPVANGGLYPGKYVFRPVAPDR